MKGLWALILWLSLEAGARAQRTREDGRCGGDFLAVDGRPADCQYIEPYPTCCMDNNHCGWICDDALTVLVSNSGATQRVEPAAAAAAPVTARPPPQQNFVSDPTRFRPDGRCGVFGPLPDGSPAECDPNSEYFCCSEHGFCGGTEEHCFCDTCDNYRPLSLTNIDGKVSLAGTVRSDRRCGKDFPLADGSASECLGTSPNYCCSKFGFCGPGPDHCDCPECLDYRRSSSAEGDQPVVVNEKIRGDRRCGSEFPLPDGSPSECNGNGPNHCCSKWGFCGPGADHCDCPTCKDFRSKSQRLTEDFNGKARNDRRCGPEFPLPDGKPSQCDAESANFCCSKWGFCGSDVEHCDCPTCFNYKLLGK